MHPHNTTWQRLTGELLHFIMTFRSAVWNLFCTGMKNKIKSFYPSNHSAWLPKLLLVSNPLKKTMTPDRFWLLSCSILHQLLKLISFRCNENKIFLTCIRKRMLLTCIYRVRRSGFDRAVFTFEKAWSWP